MDGTKFDALTKRLATGTSRRRVLTGLGGALAGALSLGGEGVPAAAADCGETLRTCVDRAGGALRAAAQACREGSREAEVGCLLQANAAWARAYQECQGAFIGCAGTRCVGTGVKPRGAECSGGGQCCSGRCVIACSLDFPCFVCA